MDHRPVLSPAIVGYTTRQYSTDGRNEPAPSVKAHDVFFSLVAALISPTLIYLFIPERIKKKKKKSDFSRRKSKHLSK
jgi:hypothetical protein